jgi:hypothetical protein
MMISTRGISITKASDKRNVASLERSVSATGPALPAIMRMKTFAENTV